MRFGKFLHEVWEKLKMGGFQRQSAEILSDFTLVISRIETLKYLREIAENH
jgi:hypothetical protein